MSAQTETNLELLVGPIEAPPCESAGHRSDPGLHGGAATTYARAFCDVCGANVIKAYCQPFTDLVRNEEILIRCSSCHHIGEAWEHVTILGPISGYLS